MFCIPSAGVFFPMIRKNKNTCVLDTFMAAVTFRSKARAFVQKPGCPLFHSILPAPSGVHDSGCSSTNNALKTLAFFFLFPFLKSVFGCNKVSLKATGNLNLYSPSWPFIHDLSAFASQELGLQACLALKHLLLKDKTIHIFRTSFYYFAFFFLCDAQG